MKKDAEEKKKPIIIETETEDQNQKLLIIKTIGLGSLLIHNPAGSMKLGSGGAEVKKIPSPKEEAEAGLYINEDGKLYFPSAGYRGGLFTAGKGRKIGKVSAISIIGAAVECVEDQTLLIDPDTELPLPLEYEVDIRRVVLGVGKTAKGILRARPKFNKWGGFIKYRYNSDFIDAKTIFELTKIAGIVAGLGDFRPEKKGPFGKYKPVAAWDE